MVPWRMVTPTNVHLLIPTVDELSLVEEGRVVLGPELGQEKALDPVQEAVELHILPPLLHHPLLMLLPLPQPVFPPHNVQEVKLHKPLPLHLHHLVNTIW